MSVFLVTGSNKTGSLTFWKADGTIQEICYYPAITNADFNINLVGSIYRITKLGSTICLTCSDSSTLQFVNAIDLSFRSTHDYSPANEVPRQVIVVGSEFWVFVAAPFDVIYVDKFTEAGAFISRTLIADNVDSLHLMDIATWDGSIFYLLDGPSFPNIYSWVPGTVHPTRVRGIQGDLWIGGGNGYATAICMHSATVAVVASQNFGGDPNIALFDLSGPTSFIKNYPLSTFPQYPAPANESTSTGAVFGVCSDRDHTLYTGANAGLHIWKIDTATDAVTIFNAELQTFNGSTGPPTNPRSPTIPYVHPVPPTDPSIGALADAPDGIMALNFLDFNGLTFPQAHYDGLMDSTDFRLWPIGSAPLPRLPDTSLTAEVRSEARLQPSIRMDGG